MIVVYSAGYHIDIGTHVFPTRKYALVHDRIRASGANASIVEPQPAAWEELASVHSEGYLTKLRSGDFDWNEVAQLELPWSHAVVEGFRLMTGGTLEAARLALEHAGLPRHGTQPPPRAVFHVGGGLHHAFADHGEGFCVFNDVAVALRVLLSQQVIERAAIIDLDVHHGNGTAAIFSGDPQVFTFSMHQDHNYPAVKPSSSLDIALPDRTGDAAYLDRLREALPEVVEFEPQLAFYLAGADPYDDDQLGGLSLTKAGLRERDRVVLDACDAWKIPVVILLAGGYARRLEDTVDIHFATFEEALAPQLS